MNASEAKFLFDASGISISEWARVNNFSATLVYQVLDGKRKCMRGQSHQIAVALGLKSGFKMDVEQLSKKLTDLKEEKQT